jgi:hypothetical protein
VTGQAKIRAAIETFTEEVGYPDLPFIEHLMAITAWDAHVREDPASAHSEFKISRSGLSLDVEDCADCVDAFLKAIPDRPAAQSFLISTLFIPIELHPPVISEAERGKILALWKLCATAISESHWLEILSTWLIAKRNGWPVRRVSGVKRGAPKENVIGGIDAACTRDRRGLVANPRPFNSSRVVVPVDVQAKARKPKPLRKARPTR